MRWTKTLNVADTNRKDPHCLYLEKFQSEEDNLQSQTVDDWNLTSHVPVSASPAMVMVTPTELRLGLNNYK